jgi:hypothetical protein
MPAQITMTLEEWNNELNARQLVEGQLAKLRGELDTARRISFESISLNADKLDAVVRASLVLTRFAVANLPPEVTPGWPTAALQEVIDGLPVLPSYGIDDADLVIEFRAMARDIEEHERRRRG